MRLANATPPTGSGSTDPAEHGEGLLSGQRFTAGSVTEDFCQPEGEADRGPGRRLPACRAGMPLKKGRDNVKFGGMGVVYFGTELRWAVRWR